MGDVALEIPLRALALGRLLQRDHARGARVHVLHEALDRAALAGGVAALEQDDDALAGALDPALRLQQLALQLQHVGLRRRRCAAGCCRGTRRSRRGAGSPPDHAASRPACAAPRRRRAGRPPVHSAAAPAGRRRQARPPSPRRVRPVRSSPERPAPAGSRAWTHRLSNLPSTPSCAAGGKGRRRGSGVAMVTRRRPPRRNACPGFSRVPVRRPRGRPPRVRAGRRCRARYAGSAPGGGRRGPPRGRPDHIRPGGRECG